MFVEKIESYLFVYFVFLCINGLNITYATIVLLACLLVNV